MTENKKTETTELNEGELDQAKGGAFAWTVTNRGSNLNVGADGLQDPEAGFLPSDTSESSL